MEIWKDIEGYEGYQISNYGRVKSLKYGKERILKPTKDKDGYLRVILSKQGKLKNYSIHRLVGQAFIDNPNNYPIINHKNEIKTDNRVENLEYCTPKYNINRVGEKLSKQVLCLETGKTYASTIEVQRQLGFANSHISSACNGKLKQAYGFHWRYI